MECALHYRTPDGIGWEFAMFHAPAHKASSAGQVSPGLPSLHAQCAAQQAEINPPGPDFNLYNGGSILILNPITPAAHDWVTDNLPDDAQRWGVNGIVVEPRYIGDIVNGISEAGLRF